MEQLFSPTAKFNELVNWPYSKIAELWGGKAYICDMCEKLYNALKDVRNNKEFSLIEVLIETKEISKELLAFISEFKNRS